MTTLRPACDIVIVNWNSGEMLADCLSSIRSSAPALPLTTTVVDNASRDDSLCRADLKDVRVLQNPHNAGFGAACNQGVAGGAAPYVLLLNPDARLEPGALETAVDWLEAHRAEAYAVCGLALVDAEGQIARGCTRAPTLSMFLHESLGLARLLPHKCASHFMSEWAHDEDREVDHVIGACYLVRRDVFTALGGFDERFYVYLEDLDLSTRIRAAGYRIAYLAQPRVFHKGGGCSEQVRATRLFYAQRSKLLYARKHLGRTQATILALVMLGPEPLIRCAFQLLRRSPRGMLETLSAYARLWRWLLLDWPRGRCR